MLALAARNKNVFVSMFSETFLATKIAGVSCCMWVERTKDVVFGFVECLGAVETFEGKELARLGLFEFVFCV